jgi:hypothetical protein
MGIFLSHTRTSNGYLPGGYAGDGYPLPSLCTLAIEYTHLSPIMGSDHVFAFNQCLLVLLGWLLVSSNFECERSLANIGATIRVYDFSENPSASL